MFLAKDSINVWNKIARISLESMKTTSMETVSTGVLDKNKKKHYLRSKDKAEKSYDVLRHIQWHMSKYKKNHKQKTPRRFRIHVTNCHKNGKFVARYQLTKLWGKTLTRMGVLSPSSGGRFVFEHVHKF